MTMAQCPKGHQTQATDFCDQCGLPVETAAPSKTPAGPAAAVCPNCGAPRPGQALFCESCGYDYTTGALPQQDLRTELGLPPARPAEEPGQAATPAKAATPAESAVSAEPAAPAKPVTQSPRTQTGPAEAPGAVAPTARPSGAATAPPVVDPAGSAVATGAPAARSVPWVAEIWVDPQWYAFQESSDPLPPLSSPRIVPLADSALIGRRSVSRQIHPDIDCDQDAGCSRRQAYLTSADGHWYINDLDSANGTYVAPAAAALPDEPITGRTPVGPDVRIYVGAWTRIVVRPAVEGDPAAGRAQA